MSYSMINQSLRSPLALLLLGALLLTGCDLANHETSIDEDELEVAAAVIAEALSEQSEGMFADLTDMTADVSRVGISYQNPHLGRHMGPRPGRGSMRDFETSYDAETGWHTITYERNVTLPQFTKTMGATLRHRYMDAYGAYVEFPRGAEDIQRIEYEGMRSGSSITSIEKRGSREQAFERIAAWTMDDLTSSIVSLSGSQEQSGRMILSRADNTVNERHFSLVMSLDGATIDRERAIEDGLEGAVTGTLSYEIDILHDRSGAITSRTIAGTVDLSGDGTAILRFDNLRQAFVIGLGTAHVQRR